MRDLPDTRVERTRSVGDVLAPSPVLPDSIESAVLACVEPCVREETLAKLNALSAQWRAVVRDCDPPCRGVGCIDCWEPVHTESVPATAGTGEVR